ncbi:uncharacterized protein LOC134275057 [Saccostrea cucullata]|uniref:uncharacterized protein LOC134275057 n=1 Tax=Saccostrea cuccullata TaxID=36930 RepID=UPI002ED2B678
MGDKFSKLNPVGIEVPEVELDLIYLTRHAEKWRDKIESLLEKIEIRHIKPRQRRIGEKIGNKWIGVCEAKFDGHIDVKQSIPQKNLPEASAEFPGMVILIGEQSKRESYGTKYDIRSYYPDKRVQYLTIAYFPDDTFRARRAVIALINGDAINGDRNEYLIVDENSEIQVGKFNQAQDICYKGIKNAGKLTESFLMQNFPELQSRFIAGSLGQYLMENTCSLTHKSQFSQEEMFLLTIGEDSICFVVYDIKETSNLVLLNKNERLNEKSHIIMEKDGINESCAINNVAVKDIQNFAKELSSAVDVVIKIQDEIGQTFVKSFLESKVEGVQFQFLRPRSIPEHSYILVCSAKCRDNIYEDAKIPKDYKSMLLVVHDLLEEEKFEGCEENCTPTVQIPALFDESSFDDIFYLNQTAKNEMHNLLTKLNTVEHIEKGSKDITEEEFEKTDTSFLPREKRRVNIKYLSDLPRKAFSDFIDRNIATIEPIWKKGEEPVEEGSLCIVVCFTLSRLLDDISAVVNISPQGCTNMLVVIQNCREGISPGPLLKHNPDNFFTDFTNILYGDGECYECDINSEASEKIQAFIDSN